MRIFAVLELRVEAGGQYPHRKWNDYKCDPTISCSLEAWVDHNLFISTLKISVSDVAPHNKIEKKFDINLFLVLLLLIFNSGKATKYKGTRR